MPTIARRSAFFRRTALLSPAPFLAAAAACLTAPPALAQPSEDRAYAPSVYVQGEWARRQTDAVTIGATLPWGTWRRPLWGGELRGHWDVSLSRWSFDGIGGHNSAVVVGVAPTLRLRPDEGRSPWFWEAGIGATVASHRYRVQDHEFSTRFNFASHLGLGRNFGAQRQHELMLSVQHVSNAGIKSPNPGENFLQLRYALHF
ncbi:MAG: acyloxyacyl hydrolase [Diaphorobacter nitroreducens]|uniref:acyloxyacyl hydrolase n=1 Tax=Diaphorobacter nitroreducens TaxID=164759 RepID=UPI003C780C2A